MATRSSRWSDYSPERDGSTFLGTERGMENHIDGIPLASSSSFHLADGATDVAVQPRVEPDATTDPSSAFHRAYSKLASQPSPAEARTASWRAAPPVAVNDPPTPKIDTPSPHHHVTPPDGVTSASVSAKSNERVSDELAKELVEVRAKLAATEELLREASRARAETEAQLLGYKHRVEAAEAAAAAAASAAGAATKQASMTNRFSPPQPSASIQQDVPSTTAAAARRKPPASKIQPPSTSIISRVAPLIVLFALVGAVLWTFAEGEDDDPDDVLVEQPTPRIARGLETSSDNDRDEGNRPRHKELGETIAEEEEEEAEEDG